MAKTRSSRCCSQTSRRRGRRRRRRRRKIESWSYRHPVPPLLCTTCGRQNYIFILLSSTLGRKREKRERTRERERERARERKRERERERKRERRRCLKEKAIQFLFPRVFQNHLLTLPVSFTTCITQTLHNVHYTMQQSSKVRFIKIKILFVQ
jgi:hypothetical protein